MSKGFSMETEELSSKSMIEDLTKSIAEDIGLHFYQKGYEEAREFSELKRVVREGIIESREERDSAQCNGLSHRKNIAKGKFRAFSEMDVYLNEQGIDIWDTEDG